MRALEAYLAGAIALAAPIAAQAVSLEGRPGAGEAAPTGQIIQASGGCGRGWHPVPGHWSRWRGEWVPPHCAPNHYGGWGGPYPGRANPYDWGAYSGRQAPYGGGYNYGRGWGNP